MLIIPRTCSIDFMHACIVMHLVLYHGYICRILLVAGTSPAAMSVLFIRRHNYGVGALLWGEGCQWQGAGGSEHMGLPPATREAGEGSASSERYGVAC
jgi:hypothetical protein